MNKNTCLFVIQISQSRSFYAVYMGEPIFFMKKYMVWLISALMAVSMTACSNTQKKDTKDQAQITTAAKENETQTEAAKTTSKKEKKNEKKKDKKKTSKKKSQKKKDFSKFNSENFVNFCQRYGYNHGYAWNGQWKGGSKKKATARGIKIGASKTKVQKAYGELTWKKCTSKDPFSKMKGLKKNKVKTYGDAVYGKYRIRFYLNSKKKVVAIIFACNISKIKKKHLKKYM